MAGFRLHLCNKINKMKITRIINREDDENEELYLTGKLLFSNGQYHMSKIFNQEFEDIVDTFDQTKEISKLKIPKILHQQKHPITVTWHENLDDVILRKYS